MQLQQLCDFCDDYLKVKDFRDYCPNGLQLEANPGVNSNVQRIVSGVTASLALIEAAIDCRADVLLVHHGYFWKGEAAVITGLKGRPIATLIRNNINLLAFHLPLDAHVKVGNNVQLANKMNWQIDESFGDQKIMLAGHLQKPQSLEKFSESLNKTLDTKCLAISGGDHEIKKIAWCTGAAQNYIEKAATRGVDAFISGEVSEQTFHTARELGIHYIAAGHHATERFGVQALGEVLAERFKMDHQYIDIANPV